MGRATEAPLTCISRALLGADAAGTLVAGGFREIMPVSNGKFCEGSRRTRGRGGRSGALGKQDLWVLGARPAEPAGQRWGACRAPACCAGCGP